jgi:energy-converting hydrogenase Eha subunit A
MDFIAQSWKAIAGFVAPLVYKGVTAGVTALGVEGVSDADISGTTAVIMGVVGAAIVWFAPKNKDKG